MTNEWRVLLPGHHAAEVGGDPGADLGLAVSPPALDTEGVATALEAGELRHREVEDTHGALLGLGEAGDWRLGR